MNQNIKLVLKWLDKPSSVSKTELNKNTDSASCKVLGNNDTPEYAAYIAAVLAYHVKCHACRTTAKMSAFNTSEVETWVYRYFARSGEKREAYSPVKDKTKRVTFTVTIEYSTDTEEPLFLCSESMKDNLARAIENERQNGSLTPSNISADWVDVKLTK